MAVTYRDFIHPEDEKAIRVIQAIPAYEEVSQIVMKAGVEQYYHSTFMVEHIRLSPKQLPKIYGLLPPVCKKFGIEEPEFYLQMDPNPQAFTTGDKRAFLVITSGLLDCVTDPLELQALIAHECGHIMCRHVFYSTLANFLANGNIVPINAVASKLVNDVADVAETLPLIGTGVRVFGKIAENAQLALLAALSYWARRSELSCDRASAVFCGNANIPAKALLRVVGGPSRFTSDIDVGEYANQCNDKELQSKWQKTLRGAKVLFADHPYSTVRINEMIKFANSERFQQISAHLKNAAIGRVCLKCGKPISEGQKFCRFCGAKI